MMNMRARALTLTAALALVACDKAPAPDASSKPERAAERIVTLQCDIVTTDNNAGTQAAAPTTRTNRTDYYRVNLSTKRVSVWDDEKSHFQDVCGDMKCDTRVSDKEFYWKRELPETKDTSLIVLYIGQTRINRSTGNLQGNAVSSVYKDFVPLRDSRILLSGKCGKSDFNGNKAKF